jgi:hypothetical protein
LTRSDAAGGAAATATGAGRAAYCGLGARGAEATAEVGAGAAASLEAVANGLENGLSELSLNRVESAEHPESQTPTATVKANWTAPRLTPNAANSLIGSTHSTRPMSRTLSRLC